MNTFLWILQGITALLYAASGVMKVFMFDKVSVDVPSFGALPRQAWHTLGVIELTCVIGLILPALLRWNPLLTVYAAGLLALETLIFVWVHVTYREVPPMIMSGLLGITMAFIAYGRLVLKPLV